MLYSHLFHCFSKKGSGYLVTSLRAEISRNRGLVTLVSKTFRPGLSPAHFTVKEKFLQRVKRPDRVAVRALRMLGIIPPHACISQCLTTHRATFYFVSFSSFYQKFCYNFLLVPMHHEVIMLALKLYFLVEAKVGLHTTKGLVLWDQVFCSRSPFRLVLWSGYIILLFSNSTERSYEEFY